GEDPIARQFLRGARGKWSTIIGIAADVKNEGLAAQSAPEYYMLRKPVSDFNFEIPEPPLGWRAASVVVRTNIPASMAAANLRSAIESIEPTLPVETETMQERLEGVTARPRFNAMILAAFGAMGTLLAATGLFGMMSFLV